MKNITVVNSQGNNAIGGIFYEASSDLLVDSQTNNETIVKLSKLNIHDNEGTDIGGIKLDIG